MYYVYTLCDPRRDDQPFYVGKGSRDRCKSHLYETYQNTSNRRKWCKIAAIKKSGLEVTIKKIQEDLSESDAYDLEEELIKKYGRIGYESNGILTNICESSRPPSAKGRMISDETRRKHSERQKGPLNHRYGIKMSDEEKEYRRRFNLENGIRPPDRTGVSHTEETKIKMSLASKGKKKSPEHCKAIGEARRGKSLGPCSNEKAKKIAESQYRNYQLTSPEGKNYTVNTSKLREMIKIFNWSYGGIMAAKIAGRKYRGWTILDLGRSKIPD
jgi:hypothetical protein